MPEMAQRKSADKVLFGSSKWNLQLNPLFDDAFNSTILKTIEHKFCFKSSSTCLKQDYIVFGFEDHFKKVAFLTSFHMCKNMGSAQIQYLALYLGRALNLINAENLSKF